MEEKLDNVQAGAKSRNDTLSSFYDSFSKQLEHAKKIMYSDDPVLTGDKCPLCGSDLAYKDGVNGRFIGCIKFPTCKYVLKEQKEETNELTGETCPQCGKPLVIRRDKKGKTFVACSGFPKCHYVVDNSNKEPAPVVKPCPQCNIGGLVKKRGKFGYFLACNRFPHCKYMEKITKKKRK